MEDLEEIETDGPADVDEGALRIEVMKVRVLLAVRRLVLYH